MSSSRAKRGDPGESHPSFVVARWTATASPRSDDRVDTGGMILGAVILREIPSWNSIVGALITLVGVAYVLVSAAAPAKTRKLETAS